MQISYRPYMPGDFEALSEIINMTWGHEKSYGPTTAARLSNAYLRLCLTEQTFTQVALKDGKPIGVIMGKDLRRPQKSLKLRLQARAALFILSLTAEGRRAGRFFEEVDQIYEKLLSGQSRHYEGELSFFAIHPDYRGLGIGGALYRRFLDYVKSGKIRYFYVFTDTTCNYGFYECQNMIRCGTEEVTLQVNGRPEGFLFFIYENAAQKSGRARRSPERK